MKTITSIKALMITLLLAIAVSTPVQAKDINDYRDVPADSWFYAPVADMSARGLMTGTTPDAFDPSGLLSRAQLACVIHRMAGSPETAYHTIFPDVADEQFYSEAVTWAADNGVIAGYKDGAFGPADRITREQLATMLYRYAEGTEMNLPFQNGTHAYPDAGNVSPFAIDAVMWAASNGIISGDNGLINPQGEVSRAVAATMVSRMLERAGINGADSGTEEPGAGHTHNWQWVKILDAYDEPVYETREIWENQPTYETRPVYATQPKYETHAWCNCGEIVDGRDLVAEFEAGISNHACHGYMYETRQVGTETVITGYERVQVGSDPVMVGTEQVQTGSIHHDAVYGWKCSCGATK